MIKIINFPNSAVSSEEDVTITIAIDKSIKPTNCKILFCKKNRWLETNDVILDYIYTQDNYSYFSKTFKFCQIETDAEYVHYICFEFYKDSKLVWVKRYLNTYDPIITHTGEGYHWSLTVYKKFNSIKWANGGIMYQIFVDRFFKVNSNEPQLDRQYKKWDEEISYLPVNGEYMCDDFYGGNLKGIENKLDYFKKLGVNILYLTPICKSKSNHRYDTLDYTEIDPDVGTWDDLKSLCDSAKKYDIHIILDMVLSHTSNEAKYLTENTNWYDRDNFGNLTNWWGFKSLVNLNKNSQEYQRFIFGDNSILENYIKVGIDGFRLDVADELPDYFIYGIKKKLDFLSIKYNRDLILYGEVWENAIKKEYNDHQRKYLLGEGLDSVMNYPFMNAIHKYIRYSDTELLNDTISEIYWDYPKEAKDTLMNIISTHDTPRAINILYGEYMNKDNNLNIWSIDKNKTAPWNRTNKFDTLGFRKWEKSSTFKYDYDLLKLAVVIQYFLPGIPCIYYGDEIGMTGYMDPFNRRPFTWDKIDNVLLDFYIELGKIRNHNKSILGKGDFKLIELNKNSFIFERNYKNKSLRIIINKGKKKKLDIPENYIPVLNGKNKSIEENQAVILLKKG